MPLSYHIRWCTSRIKSQASSATEWTFGSKFHTTGLLYRQEHWMVFMDVPWTFPTQIHSIKGGAQYLAEIRSVQWCQALHIAGTILT